VKRQPKQLQVNAEPPELDPEEARRLLKAVAKKEEAPEPEPQEEPRISYEDIQKALAERQLREKRLAKQAMENVATKRKVAEQKLREAEDSFLVAFAVGGMESTHVGELAMLTSPRLGVMLLKEDTVLVAVRSAENPGQPVFLLSADKSSAVDRLKVQLKLLSKPFVTLPRQVLKDLAGH
jgi:hypothetical protein